MADSKQGMDLYDMKNKYYLQLIDKTCRIRSSEKYILCPYCNDPNRDYRLSELMRHASHVGSESRSATFKEKAKHLGLLKYLERLGDTETEFYSSSPRICKQVEQHTDYMSIFSSYHDATDLNTYSKEVKNLNSGRSSFREIDKPSHDGLLLQKSTKTSGLVKNDTTLMGMSYNDLREKDKKHNEMEKKINQTDVFLKNVMVQQDEVLNYYNKEMKRMEWAPQELQNICIQNKHIKMHLEAQSKELEMLEKELELREMINESEKRSLLKQKKDMDEMAILEQKKADQYMLKLAEEQKIEKENLHKRIIELEANLGQKQALELEIEHLKGAVGIIVHMNEEGDIEAIKKKNLIEDELKEKEEQLDSLEFLNQTLIIKERKINDEVQEARKELIKGLKDSRSFIMVKRMGELDDHAFHAAAKRKFSEEEATEKTAELRSFWVNQLNDPSWHPFKVILNGDDAKVIIDEDDEKLSGLRQELGEEACQAAITALKEMNEYNPSGRYPVPELWNSKENRRASLKEGAEYISKAWRQKKRKRA